MVDAVTGITSAIGIGGSLLSGSDDSGSDAASIQSSATGAGIAEQRRQFDKIVELMKPFVTGGTSAFGEQGKLAGTQGTDAEQAAISAISSSPEMQSLSQQGENAILQNASATGGLRGGNTQAALAQFRPQLLQKLITERYNRLGRLSQMGQASAGLQAAAGADNANSIAELLGQQGSYQAGGILAEGKQRNDMFSNIAGSLGGMLGKNSSTINSWF